MKPSFMLQGKVPEAIVLFPGLCTLGLKAYSWKSEFELQGSPLVDLGSSPHMLVWGCVQAVGRQKCSNAYLALFQRSFNCCVMITSWYVHCSRSTPRQATGESLRSRTGLSANSQFMRLSKSASSTQPFEQSFRIPT